MKTFWKRPVVRSLPDYEHPGLCPHCGFQMSKDRSATNGATLDHILPQAANGSHHRSNLRVVCKLCNQTRAATGHCIGAMACVRAVLERKRPTVGEASRLWQAWKKFSARVPSP